MNAIWKGAMYSGLFPLNNQQLCFHNGCLKYRGQPEWIEATVNGPDNQFTLGGVFNNFLMAARTAQSSASASPASVGTQLVNATGFSRGAMRGFGALGAINGVPEAVVLVDNYLIPANTRDNPAWLVPRTALEHQILYDVADAWLAEKHPELATTPYVTNPPAAIPTQTMPAPPPINQPVTTPNAPAVVGTGAGGGGPVENFSPGSVFNPVPPSGTQPATVMTPTPTGPSVATASLGPSAIFQSPWMMLVLAGAALAVVPMMKSPKRRKGAR